MKKILKRLCTGVLALASFLLCQEKLDEITDDEF